MNTANSKLKNMPRKILTERIIEVIQSLTEAELDNISREDLHFLSQEQTVTYITYAIQKGRSYFAGMSVKMEDGIYEMRWGTFFCWVTKNRETEEWLLSSGGGLIPVGMIEACPLMVTEEKFIEEMANRKVPQDYLNKIVKGGGGITS